MVMYYMFAKLPSCSHDGIFFVQPTVLFGIIQRFGVGGAALERASKGSLSIKEDEAGWRSNR